MDGDILAVLSSRRQVIGGSSFSFPLMSRTFCRSVHAVNLPAEKLEAECLLHRALLPVSSACYLIYSRSINFIVVITIFILETQS